MRNFFGNRNKKENPKHRIPLRQKRFSLESLEDRLLLTAVPNEWGLLAETTSTIGDSGQTELGLTVEITDGKTAVIGVLVSATTDNGLDPGAIRVCDTAGNDITETVSVCLSPDYASQASLILFEVANGKYELLLSAEGGTSGDLVCSVFLPGDVDHDNLINFSECELGAAYAEAWNIAISGNASLGVIGFYLTEYGIDLTDPNSLYNSRYDANMDGVIDCRDASILCKGYGTTVKVTFHDLLEIVPVDRSLAVTEGQVGRTTESTALSFDSFTVTIQNAEYTSQSYDVARFVQVGAILSTDQTLDEDFIDLVSLGADGRFVFDATGPVFDFLSVGQTLTVSFDYYLDNLIFEGFDRIYQNVNGGNLTVTVQGVNDAPRGAADYAAHCMLLDALVTPEINLVEGVSDPEDDDLTPSIVGVRVGENDYGISTNIDFSSCFMVSATGQFGIDAAALAERLVPVPAGDDVVFTVTYAVFDPHGDSCEATVTLTVVGKNDAPGGAGDYSAEFDLQSGRLFPAVDLLADVVDQDGDDLTATIRQATLAENPYGIATGPDYSAYFDAGDDGAFTVDRVALEELLEAVPAGGEILFTIRYTVTDPGGESDFGTVSLTVIGKNELPEAAEDIEQIGALAVDGSLTYTTDLLGNLIDPDGDELLVTGITLGGIFYEAASLEGRLIDGLVYTYAPATGLLSVSAAIATAEHLRWTYNASDGTFLLESFLYRFTDGVETASAGVYLYFEAADDPAEITSIPADAILVRNENASADDFSLLGTSAFLSDRENYDVAVTVTDPMGRVVNIDESADLITTSVTYNPLGGSIVFKASDMLVTLLECDVPYTVGYTLLYDGVAESRDEFAFTVKQLQVSQLTDTISVKEGTSAAGATSLAQNAFTAEIGGRQYTSTVFTVDDFFQVSAVSSKRGVLTGDFLSYLSWNNETGYFTFDASSSFFDFLAVGETLTIAVDFYLDGLLFDGLDEMFNGIKGGTITIEVSGTNDAPSGALNDTASLSTETGEFSTSVNLLTGITDSDGDELTGAIVSARLQTNDYGISTENDYTSYFTVGANGDFGADTDALAELLKPVPSGQSVLFRIGYAVSDPYGASTTGQITLTVYGRNDAPTGAENYETLYDLNDATFAPEVNILGTIVDPDGDTLTVSVSSAYAEENPYIDTSIDYSSYFDFDAAGNFTLSNASLAELLAALPSNKTVTFNVLYGVSDPSGGSTAGTISVTVTGNYDAPALATDIENVIGSYSESVSIDLSDHFTGTITDYVLTLNGNSDILAGYSIVGSILKLNFIATSDYASTLNLSNLTAEVTAHDAFGTGAVSNTFTLSLAGAQTLNITLACVTEEFGGVEVNTLKTGASNFGTFYYTATGDVPKTDYEAIAQSDRYFLEVWVHDTSASITGLQRFFYSLQVQLNYETDGPGITSLDIEDVYAGKVSLTNYMYHDSAETLLRAIQVTWLFSEDRDVSLLEPVTNGENAFLLARFEVTANTAGSIAASGVTDSESPFVDGYYCVRFGETDPIDDSQIKTVNVVTAGTSSVRGTSSAEYVVENGVYLRTVTEETALDASGSVADIGVNADYIHEWQTHYTEIWVKASENDPLSAVSVDLAFDPTYFDTTDIEFGSAFADGNYSFDAESGKLNAIAARAADGTLSGSGYYLLARVKFEAVDDAGILWSESLAPVSLVRSVSSARVTTVSGTTSAYIGIDASTDLWANPYDVNDDGEINLIDCVSFINRYGGNSAENYADLFFDFNRDGVVDVRDFTAFANVYGLTRRDIVDGKAELTFPDSFTRRYVGSTLDVDHAELLGRICDAAVADWSEALGTEKKIDLLVVVKDLPDRQLAMAQVTATDSGTGLPTRGTIYLDNDAAGARWSALLTPPTSGSPRYDLYTVILHEIGHLYGYDSENEAFLSIASEFDWIGTDGHSTVESDLMYPLLEPGVRKTVTINDAAVVVAVHRTARGGMAHEAFAAEPTAAEWALDLADELIVDTITRGVAEKLDLAIRFDDFEDDSDGDL
ncbi:MAG: dockerin type I domain-containing protein [Thermoguttaceae bacterium]|jgi:hypothetical protein